MSSKLWQYFLQDDVESFQALLANANYAQGNRVGGNPAPRYGSSTGVLGSSPGTPLKNRKTSGPFAASSLQEKHLLLPGSSVTLTRADMNARDRDGRTLLHLAASSDRESAFEFVSALLSVPFIDIYMQDLESGWTALHRALYAGNAAIAQALLARDARDATDFNSLSGVHHPAGGLIKIKDHEGNSPFELFGTTIIARNINQSNEDQSNDEDDSSSECSADVGEMDSHETGERVKPLVNVLGDEVFTFGSNKNLSLGVGDGDDRQYPERASFSRPDHLLYRFYNEREAAREAQGVKPPGETQEFDTAAKLPITVRSQPIIVQDIVMSKLHTGIITTDPESNLFMCGFGPGGRLGVGDEDTRFNFVCLQAGAIAGKKIVSLALGQDHSIAVSEQGEVLTWGSNKYGQLGYSLPKPNQKETPIQATPRQIFNPFKKELIIGAAASSIHSVVFTSTSIYTFGKNEGQLGLMDADARSLEMQVTPRKVGASLFTQPILMVSAVDRATICLLESHDVWVFTHYGYSKLIFPLGGSSSFIRDSFLATRASLASNYITKITGGGNTICAMSSFGEVYTVDISRKAETHPAASSTTNPAKARNSLPQPLRVWSIRKAHMAVRDVALGQDGSIIICTESGSAWRKERRQRIKDIGGTLTNERQAKEYKFVRIPGLSRVVAVRSNAYGAYAAAQRSSDITREQITVNERALWNDIWPLLPFGDLLHRDTQGNIELDFGNDTPSFDKPEGKSLKSIPTKLEAGLKELLDHQNISDGFPAVVWISSTSSDTQIPVHEFMVAARSPILRRALAEFRHAYYYSIPDLLSIEYKSDGQAHIQFQNLDFLAIFNLAVFVYTDQVYGVWNLIRHDSTNAPRYRQVRTDVIKLATQLDLRNLERAARLMIPPKDCMNPDMEEAVRSPNFFDSGDVILELEGAEVRAHSPILRQRCPFFEALFHGRAGGRWLSSRRTEESDSVDAIYIDLKHIHPSVFAFVLRYIYADTDDELFKDVQTEDLDDFVDLIIDVLAVANELMLDRLGQICQKILGSYVNTRNVVHYLNAVAPCSVTDFKRAALEYICLNLEVMLENRLLDDLDPELLTELDEVCRQNQLTLQPISRGRNTEDYAMEKYPEMVSLLERDKQRRIDSMRLRSRLHEDELREEKFKAGSLEKTATMSPLAGKSKANLPIRDPKSAVGSPMLKPKQSTGDLMFQMDDEPSLANKLSATSQPPSNLAIEGAREISHPSPRLLAAATPDKPERSGYLGQASPAASNVHEATQQTMATPTREPSISTMAPSNDQSPRTPWGSARASAAKTGLKDIMDETFSSKAPASQVSPRPESEITRGLNAKMSQKERKKLKQQQMLEMATQPESPKAQPSSPWKRPPPVVNPKSPFAPSKPDENKTAPPSRTPSKTALNLRQTVAGTPPPSSSPGPSTEANKLDITPSLRAPSTPPVSTNQKENKPISESGSVPAPRPSRSPLSLAAILSQQQLEKDAIHEAVTAKHSLQDIQAEQEFQAWWDQESKRVMEEEAAIASSATAPRGRSKGRGGGRRRGRGQQPQQQAAQGGGRAERQDGAATAPTGASNRSQNAAGEQSQQPDRKNNHRARPADDRRRGHDNSRPRGGVEGSGSAAQGPRGGGGRGRGGRGGAHQRQPPQQQSQPQSRARSGQV